MLPYDAHKPLKISRQGESIVVRALEVSDSAAQQFYLAQNKWQDGFYSARDGRIYAIPISARWVTGVSVCDKYL